MYQAGLSRSSLIISMETNLYNVLKHKTLPKNPCNQIRKLGQWQKKISGESCIREGHLHLLSVAVLNTLTRNNNSSKGWTWLMGYSLSFRKLKAGTWRQKLEECCLLCCFLAHIHLTYSYYIEPPAQGRHSLQKARPFLL